jgi:hypothetical protein
VFREVHDRVSAAQWTQLSPRPPFTVPSFDDHECVEFLIEFHVLLISFATSPIVNFDESSWRLVMSSARTMAERRTETVKRYVNGHTKAAFAFFASILADGPKLPLILLAKGGTPRCHKEFGSHEQHQHQVWHSVNGWGHQQAHSNQARVDSGPIPCA